MICTVKVFAGLAEHFGTRDLEITLPEEATAADVRRAIVELFPNAKPEVSQSLIAINRTYAMDSLKVSEGDEIGLIPPVGGGSPNADGYPSCMITDAVLSPTDAHLQLTDPYCGGIVVFCGTVREWTKGRQTDYLTYEAYVEMALESMAAIEREVKEQWHDVRTIQWHRTGRLQPTDIAVICGASSPHRETAFLAARTLIERLKKEVPIWKKEFFVDEEPVWKSNT